MVWGALGVHVLSSTARRLLQTFWPASSSTSTPSPNSISSLTTPPLPATHTTSSTSPSNQTDWFRVRIRLTSLSLHALTGYLLIPTVWIHAMVHRIVPSRSSPPIRNLSPSELDYSFVSYGIARYPFTSTLVFGTLIGAASWHAIEGARKVYLRSGPGSLSLWKKTTGKTSTSAVTQNSPNPEALRPSAPSRANGKRARRQAATVAGSATGLLIAALYRIGAEGDAAVPAWLARRYEACYALVWPYSMTR